MAMDLLNIGASGVKAAQAALGMTGQNIANANNEDYNRRSIDVTEVNATGGIGRSGDSRISGVRIDGVARSVSEYLASDFRRTNSDLALADAQLAGLQAAERVVEQAKIYPALVEFEASLAQLAADPLSTASREAVLESARGAVSAFKVGVSGIDAVMSEKAFAAQAGVDRLNLLADELSRNNNNIARTRDGSVSKAALLDQRDALLRDMSAITGIATELDSAGRATVRFGNGSGAILVEGGTNQNVVLETDAIGRIQFSIAGDPALPVAGKLEGYSQAISQIATLRGQLDGVARDLVTQANAAQANGVTPSGAAGQPFFSGSRAIDIAVALTDGSGIATAPGGSPPNSRDIANLEAFRAALADGGPTDKMDSVLFGLSSRVGVRTVIQESLQAIANSASSALAAETAVDLDEEAANLVRFQQAFQASGRVIEAATDIFDTILAIR